MNVFDLQFRSLTKILVFGVYLSQLGRFFFFADVVGDATSIRIINLYQLLRNISNTLFSVFYICSGIHQGETKLNLDEMIG